MRNLRFKTTTLFPLLAAMLILFSNCSQKMQGKNALRKYSPDELRRDYDLLRDIMEKYHPSLYWYTPKDSMDFFFDHYRSAIRDSMTQQQFGFGILAPLTTQVRCGHTTFNYSRSYSSFFRGVPLPSFPLYLKIWGDTMIITRNLNRNDSILKRGMQVTSINGLNVHELSSIMFRFLPTDGFAQNINYIRLSNSFPYYHRNIFGLSKKYVVGYIDSTGTQKLTQIPYFNPGGDSALKKPVKKEKKEKKQKLPREERLKFYRSFEIDPVHNLGILAVHSFDDGSGLRKFYRQSFRTMRKQKLDNLVIDIRNNGGGKVNHYTRLAKYIRKTPFKVADTAVAVNRNFGKYGKYFQRRLFNSLALKFFTRKKGNKRYHFSYWENHVFKPFRKNHFDGKVYVLIGGPTFSASTLLCNTLAGQDNVTLIGEETGGGHHGNNGLMIPYVTLPHTKMRVSMPLFRLVQYNHVPKDGRGVIPDIHVPPVSTAVRQGIDLKMETVKLIIEQQMAKSSKTSKTENSRSPL